MDLFTDLPLPARLAILAVVGIVMGAIVNRRIYRWSSMNPPLDTWGEGPDETLPRVWSDAVPIVGWFGLAREWKSWGERFWIRPMLIELSLAIAVPALYWWEVHGGLYPADIVPKDLDQNRIQAQFLAHLILLPWILIASFVDFDERIIPQQVTLFGTLCGLALAAVLPTSLLIDPAPTQNNGYELQTLLLTSPNPEGVFGIPWPEWLNSHYGLAVGLGCWLAWWLIERYPCCTFRKGLGMAVVFWFWSLFRRANRPLFTLILIAGVGGVIAIWNVGSAYWQSLLSALVGAVIAASVTWILRNVSNAVLGIEGLGYGDVTLMAMLGAFLGWQPALIALGLGPILGIGFSIANLIINRDVRIFFGPFLCAAAIIEIVGWRWIWGAWLRERFQILMEHPGITAALLVTTLGLFAVLLPVVKYLRQRLFPDVDDEEPRS